MDELNYNENRNGEYHYTGGQINQTEDRQTSYREPHPEPHPAPGNQRNRFPWERSGRL